LSIHPQNEAAFPRIAAAAVLLVCLIAGGADAIVRKPKERPPPANPQMREKSSNPNEPPPCSKKCIAENCDNFMALRYGKYCGMGHTGCEGEKPCDEIDACCMEHDSCVGKKGLLDNGCHGELVKCLDEKKKAGIKQWTNKCSAKTVIEQISTGMQLASMFGGVPGGAMTNNHHARRNKHARNAKRDEL